MYTHSKLHNTSTVTCEAISKVCNWNEVQLLNSATAKLQNKIQVAMCVHVWCSNRPDICIVFIMIKTFKSVSTG